MTRFGATLLVGLLLVLPASVRTETPLPLAPSPLLLRHARERTPPFVDAAAPCVPPGLPRKLADRVGAQLRARDMRGAERALQRAREGTRGVDSKDLQLAAAVVEARARVGSQRRAALPRLERALALHPHPAARVCGRLERVRLLLELERPAEARVELARMRRESGPGADEVTDSLTARWLVAESAHADGKAAEAQERYTELATASDDRVRLAASLRLVEYAFPIGGSFDAAEAASGWREVPETLQAALERGLEVESFALVAGELALRAGDFGAAHHWLARAERVWPGGLVAIRKADALRAQGRREDARRTLERVARAGTLPEARVLAGIRLAEDRAAAGDRETAFTTLQHAARSSHPMLRQLAREQQAQLHLSAGDLDEALAVAVRLTYTPATGAVEPRVAEVVAASAADRDCPSLLERFATRRELLAQHGGGPEPLVALGDCLREIGLADAALDSYRAAGRAFGFENAGLALRIAEASFEAGESRAVAAALEAERGPKRVADDAARWQALAARFAVREGRRREGASLWRSLLADPALEPALRIEGERAVLALALDGIETEPSRSALANSLANATREAPELRALVRLGLADLSRAAGDRKAAASAYREAAAALPPGSARDRALLASAALGADGQTRDEALRTLAGQEQQSAWSRLGELELRLDRLRGGAAAR